MSLEEISENDDDYLALKKRLESEKYFQGEKMQSPRRHVVDPSDPSEAVFGGIPNSQWSTGDGKTFFPTPNTTPALPPGVYQFANTNRGIAFIKVPVSIDGLVRFPQANSDRVVEEIASFWQKETVFSDYKIAYKRGIILWGPPGSGKSSTIKFIMKDVIEKRGGLVVQFNEPLSFVEGIRVIREIQPETPIVVLMEDIDSILQSHNPSLVLNVLDGVEKMHKIVFLATTNYPELLGARIINRPSRFDKRIRIPHPNGECRKVYLEHLICDDEKAEVNGIKTDESRQEFVKLKAAEVGMDIEKWVADTPGFSIAHLKELFVAVCILGDPYAKALSVLRQMKETPSSLKDDGNTKLIGFGTREIGDEE
jgi:hypothetical protein